MHVNTRSTLAFTHSTLAARTLFSRRCEGHPPGPFHGALSFLSVCSRPFSFNHSTSRTPPAHWRGREAPPRNARDNRGGTAGREKKGLPPSAFIANNLLSVCDGAVPRLVPPTFLFYPLRWAQTGGSAGQGEAGQARWAAGWSWGLFLWLMNGTFEVFSLASVPQASFTCAWSQLGCCLGLSGSVPKLFAGQFGYSEARPEPSNNNPHL